MMKKPRGFTMTEILIVVVIIGILAVLMLPRFMNQGERGVVAEAVAMLSAIRQAEASWSLEQTTPAYTTTLANLDVDTSTSTKFTYAVATAAGPTFTATATRTGTGPCSSTNFGTCTVTLTDAGVWGGTYPAYLPTN